MNEEDFKQRTKQLALRVIRLVESQSTEPNGRGHWQAANPFSNICGS
ncbi:hypothetical protein [Nostoc sp. NOS(2021)]|nr:hypothetical protein [Nostoc sp. NOS(2021)]